MKSAYRTMNHARAEKLCSECGKDITGRVLPVWNIPF